MGVIDGPLSVNFEVIRQFKEFTIFIDTHKAFAAVSSSILLKSPLKNRQNKNLNDIW